MEEGRGGTRCCHLPRREEGEDEKCAYNKKVKQATEVWAVGTTTMAVANAAAEVNNNSSIVILNIVDCCALN